MPQSLSKILVHIVFSTKNKEPLLQHQIRPELYSYLAGVLQEYGSPALKIVCMGLIVILYLIPPFQGLLRFNVSTQGVALGYCI